MEMIEYQGNYRIKRQPNLKCQHNAESWAKVDKAISNAGGVSNFDALTIAVKDHESGSERAPHPYQFIKYCIKNDWLEPV